MGNAFGATHRLTSAPDRPAFAAAYRKLASDGVPVHPVNHRISWALYFNDPDGNGIEIYWDIRKTAAGTEVWEGIDRPLREADLVAWGAR